MKVKDDGTFSKWRWPTIIAFQYSIILISLGIAWKLYKKLQMLLEVGTTPASIFWVAVLPLGYQIYLNLSKGMKWYTIPWIVFDICVMLLLVIAFIIQYIPIK